MIPKDAADRVKAKTGHTVIKGCAGPAEIPEALKSLDRAVAAEPNNPSALLYRASTYLIVGDVDKARKDAAAMGRATTDPMMVMQYADVCRRLGDPAAAEHVDDPAGRELGHFTLTRPATMSRSAWRGLKRMTSAPKRERSKRLHAVAISSMPQHAVANGSGHTLERRDQFTMR